MSALRPKYSVSETAPSQDGMDTWEVELALAQAMKHKEHMSTVQRPRIDSSYMNSDMVLGKTISIFKELNPNIDIEETLFEKNIARTEGCQPIVDVGIMPVNVINSKIKEIIYSTAGRRFVGRPVPSEKNLIEIYHLSLPKGKIRYCEICPRKGRFCCSKCLVTFYCSIAHSQKDYVHELVCSKIRIIRNPVIHFSNDIDRRRVVGQKSYVTIKLLDDLVRHAFALIYQCKYEEATITLTQSMSYLNSIYEIRDCRRQLIIILSTLCEANIYRHNITEAEDMLKRSIGALYEAEDMYPAKDLNFSRALVNKCQAILLHATNRDQEAIFFFSEFVYYITKEVGPYHIRACTGYFYMAKCFLKLGHTIHGQALLAFCVDLWTKFLFDILKKRTVIRTLPMIGKNESEVMSFVTEMELRKNLEEVWAWLGETSAKPKVVCRILLSEGIMFFLYRQQNEAAKRSERCYTLSLCLGDDKDLWSMCKYFRKHAAVKLEV